MAASERPLTAPAPSSGAPATPSLPLASPSLLFNALQNGCLVIDTRRGADPLPGACAGVDGDADFDAPECFDACVLVAAAAADGGAAAATAARAVARWPTLAGRVFVARDLASFAARFPCALAAPVSGAPPSLPSAVGTGVFLGSAHHASERTVLDALRVAGVVNVMDSSGGASTADVDALGLRIARFHWVDDDAFPILKDLVEAAAAIEELRIHGVVLVHCMRGASRSAAAVAAWRLWLAVDDDDCGAGAHGADAVHAWL